MPSIVGAVNIVSVDHSAIVNFGDAFVLSPKSTSKTFAGAGSFNTSETIKLDNRFTATNVNDPHFADANIAGTL
ncbi:spore germination protein [Aneurinibacillus sp. Ricciae_BoGa-3]|uniref:spore germination protein n=1 Tax=Aneurinibacillus sp. Ricciae_BoGa-3 TaxID=3022697 RepID=UPI0023424258|nr:spore germination protein [Aneurinibacillus sp. Ricciae_BoGa-3]WCK55207.1 spore germination protein [Aneurinibacillus sp. Ricciae_BoGa-3]